MKKLFFLCCITFFCNTYSQLINAPTDIKSPNTSSLGIYGDINVGHFTGSAVINTPLYSLSEGGVNLNISLSYDSGGVRVNSVSSWVGQNWSLNAGGVISRQIRGQRDVLFRTWGLLYLQTYKGFKYSGSRLNTSDWYTPSNLSNLKNEASVWNRDNPFRDMDLEPDIFTFNFMGVSGKFFLDNNNVWKVQSNTKLKISAEERITIDGRTNDIGKITITDEKGKQFVFGSTNDEIEYFQTNLRHIFTSSTPNAWFLSKVIDKNNQELYKFDYERGSPAPHFYRTRSFRLGSCLVDSAVSTTLIDDKTQNSDTNDFFSKKIGTTSIQTVYLKKITTKSGNYINFNSSNRTIKPFSFFVEDFFNINMSNYEWRKLNQIKVYNYNNKLIRSLSLDFSPISSNRRLNLNSVKDYTDTNKPLTMYSFEYDRFDHLPPHLSKKFDKWGFFNGQDFVVPAMDYSGWDWPLGQGPPLDYFSGHDASRKSDENFALIGMLKKITYPTKGFTTFEYEVHRANKKVNDYKQLVPFNFSTPIGGARIKKIEKYSISSPPEIINYEYNQGTLMYNFTSFIPNWGGGNGVGGEYIFSINSLIPLSNINGSHIEYSSITERDANNNTTTYKYSDYNLFPDKAYEGTINTNQSIFNKSTDKSLLRGKLIEIEKKNSLNILKEKIKLEYLDVNQVNLANKYVRAFEYNYISQCDVGQAFGNAYKLFYFDYDVIKNSKTTYWDDGTSMASSVSYNYNDSFQVSEIINTNSIGLEIKEKLYYSNDSEVASMSYMSDLTNENRVSEVVKQEKFRNNQKIYTKLKKYHNYGNGNILPKEVQTSKGSNANALEDILIYHNYDDFGNPIEVSKKNGTRVVYLWGYNKTQLIAKIENATLAQVQSAVSSLPTAYNMLLKIQYLSDADNDRTIDTITNSNIFDDIFVGNEGALRNALNKLRNSPGLSSSYITTYTHDPLIGITSITDSRGQIIYYDYDDSNRLQSLKDRNGNILSKTEYNYKN